MSTKTSIISTNEDHVYWDCSNEFEIGEKRMSELTFEIDKKNIRIDLNDADTLCFSFDKDSEIYRELAKIFNK